MAAVRRPEQRSRYVPPMLALTSLDGLPAHVFLVHIPVVLIPLGALGALLMLWPRMRQMIGWWVCAILIVAGIATQLAIDSGKSLRAYVRESALVRDHTRIGENIRPWLLLLFLALVGVMIIDRTLRRRPLTVFTTRPLPIVGTRSSALTSSRGITVYSIYRIGRFPVEGGADLQPNSDRRRARLRGDHEGR